MKSTLLKHSAFILFMAFAIQSQAQLVNLGFPVDSGESKYYSRSGACNSGNDLWAVIQMYDSTINNPNIKICKNDGNFWTEYYRVSAGWGTFSRINVCFYNGDLYFTAGVFGLTLNSVTYPHMNAVFKWDGTAMTFIDSVKGNIYDMDTFKNKLIITGDFTKVGTNAISRLAEYDGSTWSDVGTPADWVNFQPGSGPKNHNQLVNQGNKLYITSSAYAVLDAGKPTYYGLAVYDGTDLSPVINTEFINSSFKLGEIYAHPDSTRYYSNDSSYKTFYCETGQTRRPVNLQKGNYLAYSETDEKFAYRGSSVYTLRGINAQWPYHTKAFIEKLTGNKLKRIFLPPHLKLDAMRSIGIFGQNNVFLMLDMGLGTQDFYRLDSNENLTASVIGTAYLDLNNNNVLDYTDRPLPNQWILINPVNERALTDAYGNYFLPGLDSGKYTIELIRPKSKLFKFPTNGKYNDSFTLDSNVTRNFGVSNDSSIMDISVSLSAQLGWRVRRSFNETYTARITNNSIYKRSGTVKLNFDNIYINHVSTDSRLVFSGNVGTITFTDLEEDQSIDVSFVMSTTNSATFGVDYNMWAELDSTTMDWDNDSTNDIDTLKLRLSAAYDPNDKTSKPSGDIKPGTRHIQYHINFQNVGNDTAYNVVIVDTVDTRLPLERITLGTSSHQYKLRAVGNVLIFEFKNIKLVDSTTNEPGSKGFIRFSALLEPNLPIGAKVDNRAHIYFDYNEAIITNTASVRVRDYFENVEQLMLQKNQLSVFPNPSSDVLNVVNPLEKSNYNLFNVNGVMIQNGSLESGENVLNISGISPGIYFIVLNNGLSTKIIIQ